MNLKLPNFNEGTSQSNRNLVALSPDYVSVDEREVKQLLFFVRKYAKSLNYFDVENDQLTKLPGKNWLAFFGGELDEQAEIQYVQELIAYLDNPEDFADDLLKTQQYSQPHLALLLSFLRLLRYPQQQFDELTKRHLDFYYRDVLRMNEKPANPDQAHVIFQLADDEEPHTIAQGTLLSAGQDSERNDLHYMLDEEIIVNQAKINQIKTLGVDKQLVNLSLFHQQFSRSSETGFMTLLEWCLGDPNPGNKLPALPADFVDLGTLYSIANAVAHQYNTSASEYIQDNFYMSVADFSTIMKKADVYELDNLYSLFFALTAHADADSEDNIVYDLLIQGNDYSSTSHSNVNLTHLLQTLLPMNITTQAKTSIQAFNELMGKSSLDAEVALDTAIFTGEEIANSIFAAMFPDEDERNDLLPNTGDHNQLNISSTDRAIIIARFKRELILDRLYIDLTSPVEENTAQAIEAITIYL
ncbi:MAG: hypothetical protein JKY13_03700, partial [Gammaproteobacteria bacterium]|nr:hypothetical protein [Gammaproteobacteria bacterium]